MPFTLAHLKTLLALSALMAAFGAGFKASASHHEIERLQNIEESYKAKEESLKRAYSRIESLLNSQAALSVKTKIKIVLLTLMLSACSTQPVIVECPLPPPSLLKKIPELPPLGIENLSRPI